MQKTWSQTSIAILFALCASSFAPLQAFGQVAPDSPCSDNPPAYTADRTIHTPAGILKTKLYVDGALQREDRSDKQYTIKDTAKSVIYLIDLTAGTEAEKKLPPPQVDQKKVHEGMYVDRLPQDNGDTMVEVGVKKGTKKVDWISRTLCGADGVYREQEIKVPGPNKKMVTIKIVQDNIQIGDVPASLFEVPDGLKKVETKK